MGAARLPSSASPAREPWEQGRLLAGERQAWVCTSEGGRARGQERENAACPPGPEAQGGQYFHRREERAVASQVPKGGREGSSLALAKEGLPQRREGHLRRSREGG